MSVVGDQVRAAVERMRAERAADPRAVVRRDFPAAPPPLPHEKLETLDEPLHVAGYKAAMAELRDQRFCRTVRYQQQQMRAQREYAHPDLLEFNDRFVRKARKLNIPVYSHCIWRSADEQTRLYVQGRSKARAGQSPHNHGLATDLVHGVLGWNLSREAWNVLGHIGKEISVQASIPVTWGGDWKFYDPAHWELKEWKQMRVK